MMNKEGIKQEDESADDLKEEIERWIKEKHFIFTEIDEIIETAHHFAEWQKQKDFEDLLKSDMSQFKECYEKGRFDMQQEIIKSAVEGTVVGRNCSTIPPFQTKCKIVVDRVSIDAKEDDKVKVIIVKS